MIDIVRVSPTSQPFFAWRFTGQAKQDWPTWVQSCCEMHPSPDGQVELRHERREGKQIVHLGEYLVKDLDGAVLFYTEAEYRREFVAA